MTWEETCAFLSPCLPGEMQAQMALLHPGELREIRVRAEQPALLCTAGAVIAVPWYPQAASARPSARR